MENKGTVSATIVVFLVLSISILMHYFLHNAREEHEGYCKKACSPLIAVKTIVKRSHSTCYCINKNGILKVNK